MNEGILRSCKKSFKYTLLILGVWIPTILCGVAMPAVDKYRCDNRTQYIIINETTNNFIGCSKCIPCGLGRELVVACGSVIGNYDSTGDCKLCDPGFYHDKSDTQQCKKCKRYTCFEHQVGEGECPTKENRDESYCANKCIKDYTMNKNGTKCDPTMPNLNSSALNHTKNMYSSTERPATTRLKTHPITNTPAKSMNPAVTDNSTKPTFNPTTYFDPNHATNHEEEEPVVNSERNSTTTIHPRKPEISNSMPVWAIAVIILPIVCIIVAILIIKRNDIKQWWRGDQQVMFCNKQNEEGEKVEIKVLLDDRESKDKEKIDGERKKDESVKVCQQEENGETEFTENPVIVPESSGGYVNRYKAGYDVGAPPALSNVSQFKNRENNGYTNSGRSSPMNSPDESEIRSLSPQPSARANAPVSTTTNGNGNNITTYNGPVTIQLPK